MSKILLTQNKYTIVDNKDFEWLNQWKWCVSGNKKYAVRHIKINFKKYKVIYMHRLILNTTNNQTDHINGDTLDNRRKNLRIVTPQQNNFNLGKRKDNKSGYKGISWDKQRNKWIATINLNKRRIYIGHFNNVKNGAKEYNKIARQYFGEFARFNNI